MIALLRIRQHVARRRIGTGERRLRNASQLLSCSIFCLTLGQTLFGQSPRIDSIDPAQGPIAGGTVVTITGANFQGATLTVDKVATTAQVLSATAIRFTSAARDNGIASIKVATSAGATYGEFLFVPPKLKDLPPGYITTVAGIGTFTGYYRQATQAEIQLMGSPAYDQSGNLYIPEPGRHRVSRVRPDGIIEPFAGTGIGSFIGGRPDVSASGPATEMALNFPRGVTTDSSGYVYFTDFDSRLHRVDTRTGIITTIAGNGTAGFSGDGGPAVRAQLTDSTHITGDGSGTLFFIDFDDAAGFGRIRKITPDGTISTVAGVGPSGFSGDGGPATQAQFNLIYGDRGSLTLDSNGNLFVADPGNSRIRRIDGRTGIITTARYHESASEWVYLAADRSGNIYFNEDLQILKMGPTGQIVATYGMLASSSGPPSDFNDGTPINSATFQVHGLAIDPSGNIVYMEVNRVRRLNLSTGLLETLAGTGWGIIGDNGPAIASTLAVSNEGVAFLPSGELLIGDGGHTVVRKLNGNGDISVFAKGYDPRIQPNFSGMTVAITPDGAGNIYLTDTWSIFRIAANGTVNLIAGRNRVLGYSGDGGPATDALLCQPWDVALDGAGNIFIADTNNNRIRRVDARTGIITTVAGSGPVNGLEHYEENGHGSYSGDGGPALQACLNTPYGVTVDSKGNLFIADAGSRRIRKVDTNGIISTFVANVYVTKLVFDKAGNLYGATDGAIFRFDSEGRSTQIAGRWPPGFSGDGGPALQAQARASGQSTGIAIDAEGNIFFLDNGNYRVRAIRYGALLAPPAITTPPASARVTAGQPAVFAVAVTGFPTPSFQWKKNEVNIPGATDAIYTVASAQISDASNYSVVITNVMGSTTSGFAKLSVVSEPTPPSIAAPPAIQTVAAGGTATFTILVNGIAPLNYQWSKGGVTIAGATTATLTFNNVQVGDAGSYSVSVSNSTGSITSSPVTLTVNVPPIITTQPVSRSVAAGVGTTFSVSAIGTGTLSYQWRQDGVPIVGATSAALTLNGAQAGNAGSYTVVVTNSTGSVTSTAAILTVNFSRLTNLSVLTTVTASTPLFTVGTVIGGTGTSGSQPLLVRAAGPSLTPFGVTGPLADPRLVVFSGQIITASNDDWSGTAALSAAFAQVGAFAYTSVASKDSAVYNPAMPAGAYTVQVSGVGGATGAVIAELYDATPTSAFTAATPRLINLSVLKQINVGEILTAGFVIAGSATKNVLIRAVGPALGGAPFNIPGVMADPQLVLYQSGVVAPLTSNNDWGGGTALATAFASVGAFAFSNATSKDAALLVTLQPGNYTAQVTGVNGSAGLALVEVYEVP